MGNCAKKILGDVIHRHVPSHRTCQEAIMNAMPFKLPEIGPC
jgi:hypothetical protein